MNYLNDASGLIQSTYAGLNHIEGLLIALIAAILMKDWKQLFPMALGATLAYQLFRLIEPALHGGAFRLPPDLLTLGYWLAILAQILIFALIIALFFFVKSIFIKTAKA